MKACLSIFNRKHGAHTDIAKLFENIFPGIKDRSRWRADPCQMEDSQFLEIGSAEWHTCEIETPASELKFAGANLFERYWVSAARGTFLRVAIQTRTQLNFSNGKYKTIRVTKSQLEC